MPPTAAARVLLATAIAAAATPSRGEEAPGPWELCCEGGARPVDNCAVVQTARADVPGAALTVIVVPRAEGDLLRVVAPTGVLIPSGLGLSIDDADKGVAGFVRCLPTGCVAEVALDASLGAALAAGRTARFTIHTTPDEAINHPDRARGPRRRPRPRAPPAPAPITGTSAAR